MIRIVAAGLTGIFLVLFGAGSASAQDIEQLKNDVQQLRAEVSGLKSQLSRMIVAFNKHETAQICPDGSYYFGAGGGRLLVGAGPHKNTALNGAPLTVYPSFATDPQKATGGEQNHQLTVPEMPSHDHGYNSVHTRAGRKGSDAFAHWDTGANEARRVTPTGVNQPHNNMPPYIALYFCAFK